MHINPEQDILSPSRINRAIRWDMANGECDKHQRVLGNNSEYVPHRYLVPTALASDLVNLPLIHMICPTMIMNS